MLPLLRTILILGVIGMADGLRAAVPADARFLMSFFKANGGGGDERLYIGTSPDGLTWTSLNGNNPVWQPPNWATFQNVVRDPSIIYDNGWYWVAFTSGNYGNHAAFGLVKSQDLLNWTYLGDIPVPIPGATAQLTWNPCFFRDGDGSVHLFLNISPDGGPTYNPIPNLKSYVTEPASGDWTQWTTPVPLQLPSTNTNEFYCWKEGPIYHAAYVNFNDGGGWEHATSTNLVSGWVNIMRMTFNGYEGGNMLKNSNGTYRFLFENGSGYLYSNTDPVTGYWQNYLPVTADVPMQNGKMIAVPNANTFAAWAALNVPSAPAPLADPDGDGICNLLECALGSNPAQADRSRLPTASVVTFGGNQFLRLQYFRQSQYVGLQTGVQSSTDLSSWSPVAPLSITLMSDGSELVEARIPLSGGPQYLRVEATQN